MRKGDSVKNSHLAASIIGNVLEWYDFAIYGYLAGIFGVLFFPSENPKSALLMAFSVFAIGYLARPLGGIIFGQIGDRYGRSKALWISMCTMGVSTACMGLLPTYTQIGIYATAILIFLRVIQGVSAGGELVGSTVYVFESSPLKNKTFFCSWVTSSCTVGVLLGSFVVFLLHNYFTLVEIENGGWRIPYFGGIFLAVFGMCARKYLPESRDFKNLPKKIIQKHPIIHALKTSKKAMAQIISLNIFVSISFYTLFVWMPTFLYAFLHVERRDAFFINTLAMSLLVVLTPLMGLLGDFFGRKRIACLSALLMLLVSYPLFVVIVRGLYEEIFFASLLFAVCFSLIEGTTSAITASIFPTECRYSGAGISYNFSMSIFGGTAPLVCTYLISRKMSLIIPALYISASAIVGILAIISMTKSPAGINLNSASTTVA